MPRLPKLIIQPTHAEALLPEAASLKEKGYGEPSTERLILLPEEAVYLLERKKALAVNARGQQLTLQSVWKRYARLERFTLRMRVYAHLRDKGLLVKSGAKYGVDYRVYTRQGVHSDWLVQAVSEVETISYRMLAGWARLAHSVRKQFMLAMLTEADVVLYTLDWQETLRKR